MRKWMKETRVHRVMRPVLFWPAAALSLVSTLFLTADVLTHAPPPARSATAAVSTTGTPVRLSETMAENVLATQDMAQVAFWSGSGGNPDIYVTSVDGGEPKRLTDDPAPDIFRFS